MRINILNSNMKKLILYSIACLLNISTIILILIQNYDKIYKTVLFLTFINFCSNTFYFSYMWQHELRLFLNRNNSDNLKAINSGRFYVILRDRIFKFIFSMCMSVCFGLLVGSFMRRYYNKV